MLVPWTAMNPRDIFDSLACAPRKVAGPWLPATVYAGAERFPPCRRTPDQMTIVWEREGRVQIHGTVLGMRDTRSTTVLRSLDFATREEADAWLRSDGWLLADCEPTPPLDISH